VETIRDRIRSDGLGPPTYFTVCDALQGFLQQKLSANSSRYCGIETPRASYVYNMMPLGLVASGYEWNRTVAKIIKSMDLLNILCYVDDIVLWSRTADDHINDLETMLGRLQYYQLRLKGTKCSFMKKSIKFLGLVLDGEGVRPDPRKGELIAKLQSNKPKDTAELSKLNELFPQIYQRPR